LGIGTVARRVGCSSCRASAGGSRGSCGRSGGRGSSTSVTLAVVTALVIVIGSLVTLVVVSATKATESAIEATVAEVTSLRESESRGSRSEEGSKNKKGSKRDLHIEMCKKGESIWMDRRGWKKLSKQRTIRNRGLQERFTEVGNEGVENLDETVRIMMMSMRYAVTYRQRLALLKKEKKKEI
jgi:mannitol-specific phosphotransferase system IIBC component